MSEKSEIQLRALKELARSFPDDPSIGMSISWVNGSSSVGVAFGEHGPAVFFNSAEELLSSLDDAEPLLRSIFADEIVCVTGYHREQFVFCRLAPADAIAERLPTPGLPYEAKFEPTDHVVVETWSRGLLPEAQ